MEKTENIRLSKINAVRKTDFRLWGLLAIFAAVTSLTSCVKDELFNTPHPEKGAIVVRTDWSGIAPENLPDTYTLNVDGEEQTADGHSVTVDKLAEPGRHTLLVYNRPEGITLTDGVATVNDMSRQRSAERLIHPLPGHFFTARQEIKVIQDDTLRVDIPMAQRTRDLLLELTVTDGDPGLIKSVTGTLTGIAGAFDLAVQQITGEAVGTAIAFARAGDRLTADARLMGIIGTVQSLVLEVRFTDREDVHRVSVDLSKAMGGFNDDMTSVRKITGSVETPTGMDVTATIDSWKDVEGDPVEAE